MADIKIAGRIKAGAADNIAGYASEILFDDEASNKTVKEKIEEAANSPQTMIVTITPDGNDGYEADKTFAEIKAFLDNGGTVIAKDEEDGDSYYYLDNYIASEVVFTRNIWGSGGFSTRYYTIDNTNTVSFIDSVHFISSDVNSSSTANLANSAAVKTVNDKVATKQDTISDLSTIRSGASAGATAYQKPQAGIPKTDLASAVQTSLGKADTAVQPAAMNTALAAKQDTLTFDNAPTANSNNPVKSGGIKTALDAKQDTISDIATIRSNAAAGATAYQKPGTGIPPTDLASAVQTSLGKADTAIQSVTVGTTTTGAAGSSASVTNTGTATEPVLSFTIPQGAQGIQGIQGPQGERGPQGNTGVQVDSVASIIHSIDPTATYAAADVAGADAVQDVLSEVTELAGKFENTENELSVSRNVTLKKGTIGYDSTSLGLEANTTYRVVVEFGKGITKIDSAVINIVPTASSGNNAINITPTVHIGDAVVEKIITTDSTNAHQYLRWYENDQNNTATVKFYKVSSNAGELGIKHAYSPTWLDGGIDTEGSVTAAGNYFHTSPIHLGIGDTIYISTAGYGLSTISTTDSSGSSYTPQVIVTSGSSTALSTYQWTATEDCYVSCCGKLLSADAPARIEIEMDNIPKLYDCIGQNVDGAINQETITKLLTKGADSYSETKDVSNFHIYNGRNNSGVWDTSYGKFIVIPTVGLDSVYLGTPKNQSLYWAPLKSFTEPVSGGVIDFCDGFSRSQTVGPNVSTTVSIPDDCNFLLVFRYLGSSNQYNVTPSSIVLNFKSVVSMSGIEGGISTDTTKIGEMPIYAAENGSIYNNSTNVQICSKFIPVKASTKYRFSSSQYNVLCILTSDSYTAGQSISNFATGESARTISDGGNLELTTSSDAAYALLRTTAYNGTPITISVTEITDVSTAFALCDSRISEVENSVERLSFNDAANIRYSDFYDSSLSDNEVWDNILSATSFIPKKNIVIDRDITISRVLYVGSNTTIYIDNVTIKQADDVFDNVFRGINEIPTTSEGYEIVAGENLELLENIKILGVGNARIEGPDSASKIATDSYGLRTVQVLFDRVKGLEIGNITYSKTRGWCHCLMFVEDAYIHDILFDNLENGANRDGFDFRSGCHDIVVENVGGRTGDDLFAFHAHNVSSLDGTREGYSKNGVRRYFCAQYIDKLNNENRLSELDVHDCRINNAYKYNGYWHVGICLAAHGTYTYNISITNINVGGHITSGQSYIQGLITLYKYGNYVDDHMHDILVSNVVNDSDSNMPVFNNDCKVSNVWVNKLVNNTTNKTADIQYGDGVTLLNTENYHRISGTFTQSGTALVNKDIVFTSSGVSYTAKTNSNGYNTFLPAGTYTVTCSGCTLSISSVTIGSSDVVQNISAT